MKKLIYLDTNAFELIAESKKYSALFKNWINRHKIKLVVTSANVSELVKKHNKFNAFNYFINDLDILSLGRHSSITDLEKKYYPNSFNIEETSINEVIERILAGAPFDFNDMIKSKNFQNSIIFQSFVKEISFPNSILKFFVQNPPKNGKYSKCEQLKLRNKIINNLRERLSKETGINNIDLNHFKTEMIIIEFLFKKHLTQPIRKSKRSDFVDILHIAYIPYMDYFVTEKDNCNILNQIKKINNSCLTKTNIFDLSEFKKLLLK